MLINLLGYVALGLLLAMPLWRLLRWLAVRSGLYAAPWQYLRPYVPAPKNTLPR
jgi:Sec-independent protein secretion pathway component TatC